MVSSSVKVVPIWQKRSDESDTHVVVTYGAIQAKLYLADLRSGSQGECIEFSGLRWTPDEWLTFISRQFAARKTESAWKSCIFYKGHPLSDYMRFGMVVPSHPTSDEDDEENDILEVRVGSERWTTRTRSNKIQYPDCLFLLFSIQSGTDCHSTKID